MTVTLAADISRVIEAAAASRRARHTARARRRLAAALGRAFTQQGRAFLARFARQQSAQPAREVLAVGCPFPLAPSLHHQLQEIAEPDWEDDWEAVALASIAAVEGPLTAAVLAALRAGATYLLAQLDIDEAFDLENPRATAYVQAHGAALVTQINQTTRDRLRAIIAAGVEAGDSYSRITSAIRAEFADMSRTRAQLIATTEVGNAYEAGNALAAQQLADAGLELEKSWLTAGDERVDPHCRANQDAGWIPLGDAFPSGSMEPLDHPRCRCTCLYRRKGSDDEGSD